MLWIVVSTFIVSVISIYLGHSRLLYIDQITVRRLSISLLSVLILFLILQWLHRIGYFPEAAAGFTMANVYAGGDIVTGSATVIEAMGAGRIAANAMHEKLTALRNGSKKAKKSKTKKVEA